MAGRLPSLTDGPQDPRGRRPRLSASSAFGEITPLQPALPRDVELTDRTNRSPSGGDDVPKTGVERLRTRRTSDLARVLNPKENQGEEGQGEEGKRTPGGRRRRGPTSGDGSLPDSPDRAGGRRPRTAPKSSRFTDDAPDSHHPRGAGSRHGATGEVHFVGAIVGATGFPARTTYASWEVDVAEQWGWTHYGGLKEGKTQPSGPSEDEEELSVWEHPIDLHLKTTTLQRWPRIIIKVFHRSKYNQGDEFYGYACVSLPTTPGIHEFSCRVWRPNDGRSLRSDEYNAFWTGLYPQCVDDTPHELLQRPGWDISGIMTAAMGEVHFRLFTVFKGMESVAVNGAGANRRHLHHEGRRLSFTQEGDGANSPGRRIRSGRSRTGASSVASDEHSSLQGGRHSRQSSIGSHMDEYDHGGSPGRPRTAGRHRRTGSRTSAISLDNSYDLEDAGVKAALQRRSRDGAGGSSRPRPRRVSSRLSEVEGPSGGSQLGESRDSLPDLGEGGSTRLRERYGGRSSSAPRTAREPWSRAP